MTDGSEAIDDFLQVLEKAQPAKAQPATEASTTAKRKVQPVAPVRRKKEKHAHLTRAQLAYAKRGATRTSTLNTRVSPEFHNKVKTAAAAAGSSIADILELALDLYLKQATAETEQ